MFNLRHIDAAGLRYRESEFPAEDYDLWERAGSKLSLANIPLFLLDYRLHRNQTSTSDGNRQRIAADRVRQRALRRLGVDPAPPDLALHCDYAAGHDMKRLGRLRAARAWLGKLETAARLRGEPAIADECAARARVLKARIRRKAIMLLPAAIERLARLWRRGTGSRAGSQ
jgi:hypothetical protein